jgi:hypothetical protein
MEATTFSPPLQLATVLTVGGGGERGIGGGVGAGCGVGTKDLFRVVPMSKSHEDRSIKPPTAIENEVMVLTLAVAG